MVSFFRNDIGRRLLANPICVRPFVTEVFSMVKLFFFFLDPDSVHLSFNLELRSGSSTLKWKRGIISVHRLFPPDTVDPSSHGHEPCPRRKDSPDDCRRWHCGLPFALYFSFPSFSPPSAEFQQRKKNETKMPLRTVRPLQSPFSRLEPRVVAPATPLLLTVGDCGSSRTTPH